MVPYSQTRTQRGDGAEEQQLLSDTISIRQERAASRDRTNAGNSLALPYSER
jgi:hypothetical protein